MSTLAPPFPEAGRLTRPRLAGDGPASFSTCVALERSPAMVYDVNGYYRALGVAPSATKHQIARAYHECGTHDAYLTYVVTQLLDPQTRAAYDAMPLGSIFVDRYVLEWVRARRSALLAEERLRLGDRYREAISEPIESVLDNTRSTVNDRTTDSARWPWSYYLWDTDRADEDVLRSWQEALSVALGRVGAAMQISVGLTGETHPEVEVVMVGRRIVVFVNEQCHISDALAVRAGSLLTER